MQELVSPADTKGWKSARRGEIEVFTLPDGSEFTRCGANESPDVVVRFASHSGELRLRNLDESRVVKRIARRERRAARELKKRGY